MASIAPSATGTAMALPDIADIRAAHARIAPYVHRTPVFTCASLDGGRRAALLQVREFQKVGAFKARGACNAVFSLADDAATRGVVTHSSGNHGAALAYAAQQRGIPAFVVMPENAAKVKQANVARCARRSGCARRRRRHANRPVPTCSARPARRWCIPTTTCV